MKGASRNFAFMVFTAVVLMILAQGVLAQTYIAPKSAKQISIGTSDTRVMSTFGYAVPAQAGNVTALTISDVRSTQFWQGYYGNITGRIELTDGQNSTMFAWELASPAGQIFAVNDTGAVQWDNVTCVNFTTDVVSQKINLTTLAVQFNMNVSPSSIENLSKDAFNYTFNTTFTNRFTLGHREINALSNCPQANTFIDGAYQTGAYREVLMFDNQSALIFATSIENNLNGYQAGGNDMSDFQMMVAETGTPGYEAATTYYFYVELM